jgi:hypothetical protein
MDEQIIIIRLIRLKKELKDEYILSEEKYYIKGQIDAYEEVLEMIRKDFE